MLNHITLQGRLVSDPELRYTASQTPVATFRLAVERNIKDCDGNRQTDFINCMAWGKTGEMISQYFTKGRMMVLEGRIQTRSYKAKDGGTRYVTEVVCERVYFVDSKKETEHQRPSSTPHYEEYEGFETIDEDDVPF